MTYKEYVELQERFSAVETEYLETWKALKSPRKRSKKLARLSLELIKLNDELIEARKII